MAQPVKRPTLDFGSGHDLRVIKIEPRVQLCTGHGACLGFSPSPFPSHLSLSLSLSLKIEVLPKRLLLYTFP